MKADKPLERTVSDQELSRRELSGTTRLLACLLALGLLTLLLVASALKPNAQGRGTHEQMGLPPCTFVLLFDKPCPSCGMTTSWSWLVRGNVVRALQANVGGTMLAAMAIVAVPWLAMAAFRKRWSVWIPDIITAAWVAVIIALVTFVDWVIRLWFR